jgi:hypothetical protein
LGKAIVRPAFERQQTFARTSARLIQIIAIALTKAGKQRQKFEPALWRSHTVSRAHAFSRRIDNQAQI